MKEWTNYWKSERTRNNEQKIKHTMIVNKEKTKEWKIKNMKRQANEWNLKKLNKNKHEINCVNKTGI